MVDYKEEENLIRKEGCIMKQKKWYSRYLYSDPQWRIYNEDVTAMSVDMTFTVMVIKP